MSDKQKRKPAKRDTQTAQSQASQRPAHRPKKQQSESGSNQKSDGPTFGRNTTKAERRLCKDRPDLYALRQLLRSDRRRTGGWVRLGKLKGAYA
jgi:hypothetical protein